MLSSGPGLYKRFSGKMEISADRSSLSGPSMRLPGALGPSLLFLLLALAPAACANVMPDPDPTPAIAPCSAVSIAYFAQRWPGSGMRCSGNQAPAIAPAAKVAASAAAVLKTKTVSKPPALIGGFVQPKPKKAEVTK